MSFGETLRTAIEAVLHRRMRSLLTVLGILIGIAAVILTVGLGQGAQNSVASQINALGSNLLIVTPGSTVSASGVRGGRGSATTLTTADAAVLSNRMVTPDVAAVAAVTSTSSEIVAGTTNWTTTINGTTPAWLSVRNRSVADGRFITAADVSGATPVMVLGQTTATDLFGARSPVGQTVTVSGQSFSVIGVLAAAGSASSLDQDDLAVVPSTTFAARLSTGGNSVSDIYVEGKSTAALSSAYQEVNTAMLASHGVTAANADFTVTSQESLVQTATATTHILTVLLGGIAGISLLVGGIGVMNIMLVSVTERIREIGLRKALGATPRVIRKQFLVEASILGLVGGIAGLALGLIGAALLPRALGEPVDISAVAAAAALITSVVVGIVAGVYPASRAANLAPIEALRTE